MTHLIDKSDIVAELERKRNHEVQWMQRQGYTDYNMGLRDAYVDILSYIESLEVKEVDLEKELSYEDYIKFFDEHPNFPDDWGFDEAWIFAKYFFELGLKAQKE